MVVLEQLNQEREPIGLSDLLKKLGDGYPERSVRRWLSEMVTGGIVAKIGHKRATKYQVINRTGQETDIPASCFGLESVKIIEQIRRPIYERAALQNIYKLDQTYLLIKFA